MLSAVTTLFSIRTKDPSVASYYMEMLSKEDLLELKKKGVIPMTRKERKEICKIQLNI
jgi:hypothetical protein